jgi:thiol-disulfide isomerase/thioredoxin
MSLTSCALCNKPAERKCNGCKAVVYCDRTCQKRHWKMSGCGCKAKVGSIFEANASEGNPKYKTFDNDTVMGFKCPDLGSLVPINGKDYAMPTKDQVTVLVFWAQFHKPGYKFLHLYTKLQEKYGKKISVVGVSTDPSQDYPEKFLDDPKKKYAKSGNFDTRFLVAWDKGSVLKEAFSSGIRDTLNVVHSFVVSKGTVVWHQDHSEHGATAPTYMQLMEKQMDAILKTGKATSVGTKEVESDSGSDSDDGETMDIGDTMDLF